MTNLEVIAKVRTHLLTQKDRAYEGGQCRYRTTSGLRCAIGCLIPDEAYEPDFEDTGLGPIGNYSKTGIEAQRAQQAILTAAGLTQAQQALGYKLQCLHDNEALADWDRLLTILAQEEAMKSDMRYS